MRRVLNGVKHACAVGVAFVWAKRAGRRWGAREPHRAWLRANWDRLSAEERANVQAWLDAAAAATAAWPPPAGLLTRGGGDRQGGPTALPTAPLAVANPAETTK